MDRETNKRLEFEFGKAFFEELNSGDSGSLIHDDNPDFFTTKERHTGFELTQIYREASKGNVRFHVEGSWDKLMIKLKEVWDFKSFPPCHVNLIFIEPFPVQKNNIDKKADMIVTLISKFIPDQGTTFESPGSMLINIPNLAGFTIERIINYESSLWSYFDSSWSSSLNPQAIQNTIDKKECKREDYLKRCNIIWLVIALYGGRASGDYIIPRSTIEFNYKCYFDRLFLFDCISRKINELNLKL